MRVPGGAAAARRRYAAPKAAPLAQLQLVDVDAGEQGAGPCDDDERYTSARDLEWCRRIVGVDSFTLDVAACQAAQCAPRWFGIEENGLLQLWSGNVWCNPPFSNIELWLEKAWAEWRARLQRGLNSIAMLLPANRTDQRWWHRFVEPYRDRDQALTVHFLPGRPRFRRPGSSPMSSPPFGCVLLVWRARAEAASAVPTSISR